MDEKLKDLKKTQKQKLKKKSSLLISFYEYKVMIKLKVKLGAIGSKES